MILWHKYLQISYLYRILYLGMKIKQIEYSIGFLILSVLVATATATYGYATGSCLDGTNAYEGSASIPADIYSKTYNHSYGFCADGTTPGEAGGTYGEYNQNVFNSTGDKTCGGVGTSVISCDQDASKNLENNGIYGILLIVINILSAGIGIAAVGGVVYAAVLYSSAGANADNVKKAKGMFVNIGIGIVAYILMYSFLNYLIPGGLFN